MSASEDNLGFTAPSDKQREGHAKVTPEQPRRESTPTGPHKTWANFVRNVLSELGWSVDETVEKLCISRGWYKKAINGKQLDGSYREGFQKRLTEAWEDRRKKHPYIRILYWPSYVENAPWDSKLAIAGSPTENQKSVPDNELLSQVKRLVKGLQNASRRRNAGPHKSPYFPEAQIGVSLSNGAGQARSSAVEDQPYNRESRILEQAREHLRMGHAKKALVLYKVAMEENWHHAIQIEERRRTVLREVIDATIFAALLLGAQGQRQQALALLQQGIGRATNGVDREWATPLYTWYNLFRSWENIYLTHRGAIKGGAVAEVPFQIALEAFFRHGLPTTWFMIQYELAFAIVEVERFDDSTHDDRHFNLYLWAAETLRSLRGECEGTWFSHLSCMLGKALLTLWKFSKSKNNRKKFAQALLLEAERVLRQGQRCISRQEVPILWTALNVHLGVLFMSQALNKSFSGSRSNSRSAFKRYYKARKVFSELLSYTQDREFRHWIKQQLEEMEQRFEKRSGASPW
jgi:hypothetical protein